MKINYFCTIAIDEADAPDVVAAAVAAVEDIKNLPSVLVEVSDGEQQTFVVVEGGDGTVV